MKMILVLCCALALAGCGHYQVTVYGANGAAYTAPDLCAAELACAKAGETSCYANDTTETTIDPQTGKKTIDVTSCRKVTAGN